MKNGRKQKGKNYVTASKCNEYSYFIFSIDAKLTIR